MNDLAAKKSPACPGKPFFNPEARKGPKKQRFKNRRVHLSFAGIEMVALLLVQKKLITKKAAFGMEITACNRRL